MVVKSSKKRHFQVLFHNYYQTYILCRIHFSDYLEDAMTGRKSKSKKTSEQRVEPKNPTHDEEESVIISLPSNFPFEDLMCAKLHEEAFKSLFRGSDY